jgi:Big-like domain-containing protein/purple acid phosphatase-like protein/VCBS repeat protein/stigma-specific protein Stig1
MTTPDNLSRLHPGGLMDASPHHHVRKPVLGSAVSTLAVFGAVALSLARAAAAASSPDPTLLPVATTSHVPLTSAYNALGVPSLPAGASYQDPTTGVRIYKLTSATFPAASANWGHDYSEGGNEVSLPYDGETRAVLVRQNGGPWWLVDFTPGTGVSNPRPLTGTLAPFMDTAFTFSSNPATPYYAYVSGGSTIRRFDIRTMTEAAGGGWPVTGESSAMWIQQSEDDQFFVWMRGANGTTVVGYEPCTNGYEPCTNTMKTYTNPDLNEPRIDRAGRYVGISMNSPRNGLVVWDWLENRVTCRTPGDPGIPFAHNASLRRRWVSVDWNMSYPPDFVLFEPDAENCGARHIGGPANGTLIHGNGNWIQHPVNLDDQWAVFCHYGSLRPAESYWLAPGAFVLMTPSGERRVLGHPYNTTSNYTYFTFAKFSPDGQYVLFTSNMNGSGRSDVFLAELPQAEADTTPPTVSITAPAAGPVVGTVAVSAAASDDVGVAGVRFRLDQTALGAEDTAAPFSLAWNTLATANGQHRLTAVARDLSGNTATSSEVLVTVSNPPDSSPPVLSGITATAIGATAATITWTSDEPADSQVEYGTSPSYGFMTPLDASAVTSHSWALGDLAAATLYHYRVRSRDAAGNLSVSGDFSFTTLKAHQAEYTPSCPLPPLLIDTSTVPTAMGATYTPRTSAELTTALQNVEPGDQIVLDSRVTYTGPFSLKPQPAGNWVIIRSDQTANAAFPAPATRVTKSKAALLPKIVASNGNYAIKTLDGANHKYWIIGLEIMPATSGTAHDSLVEIGSRTATTNQATNIVFDRVYVHGCPSCTTKRAFMLNGRYLSVINSRIGDIHTPVPGSCPGASESQGVVSFNGSGPYKIHNNYVAAGTQNIMFGGQDAKNSSLIPADIEVSLNHMYKPITTAWRNDYLAKTTFELKAAVRAAVVGNYLENSWDNCPGEKSAQSMRLTPRNQDGGAPFTSVQHVRFTNNKFVNHPRGLGVLGSDNSNPSGQMICVAMTNNLFIRIPGNFAGDPNHNGRFMELISGGVGSSVGGTQDFTFMHNTVIFDGQGAFLFADYGGGTRTDKNVAFRMRNNIITRGAIAGSGTAPGNGTLAAYFSSPSIARNDMIGETASYSSVCSTDPNAFNYCWFHSTVNAVGFTNYAGGDYRLTPASPLHDQCTHRFDDPPDRGDVGIVDWSTTTGVGMADRARDVQPDSPPGCTTCGSDCYDLQADPYNCGSCGNACAPGESCTAGTCTGGCGGGGTLCSGQCVDTQTDPYNCGSCGDACAPGESCTAGTCTGGCTDGLTSCSGQCVDTQTDPTHCGSCGNTCGTGQSCSSGRCVARSIGTDIDGDGKADFLARKADGAFSVWKSNGTVEVYQTSFSSYYTDDSGWNGGNRYFPMDLNGDGKTDMLMRGANGGFDVNLSNGTILVRSHTIWTGFTDAAGWNTGNRFLIVDVNGDRKSDLLARQSDGTFRVLISDGTNLNETTTFSTYYTDAGSWGTGNRFYALDLTGDGRTDFIARGANGGWDTLTSNGTTYVRGPSFTSSYTDAGGYNSGNHFFVLDIDGGGRGDLVARRPDGTFDVWLSNGTIPVFNNSFTTWFSDGADFESGNRFLVGDVTGDGKTDMMMRYGNGGWDVFVSRGTTLEGTSTFFSSHTDADGWNSGLRFF